MAPSSTGGELQIYVSTNLNNQEKTINKLMKLKRLLAMMAIVAVAAGCSPTTYLQIDYLQDLNSDASLNMKENMGIVIQPQDQLYIVVSSRNPELSAALNKPTASYQAGSEITSTTGGGAYRLLGYVVDNAGDIDFPMLGNIHVAGLTRWELQDKIKEHIISEGILLDPIVTVEFMNFRISVMGEVNSPGTYTVTGDKITLLGALALASDLTIFGRRDNVTVIREQNGKRNVYKVDLRNSSLFDSPAYYLQQNDVVYVYPNSVRAGQSTINENYFKSGSFWISLSSVAITVTNLSLTLT